MRRRGEGGEARAVVVAALCAASMLTAAGCAGVLGVDLDGYDARGQGGASSASTTTTTTATTSTTGAAGGAGHGGATAGGASQGGASAGGSAPGGASQGGGGSGAGGGDVSQGGGGSGLGGGGASQGGAGGGSQGGGGAGPIVPVPGPSCTGGLDCGGLSCCDAIVIPATTFPMGRSAAGPDAYAGGDVDELPEHDATVASFALDTFEVTVGRFRKFVEAYAGVPPVDGAGAHPAIPGSGWRNAWNVELPATEADLRASLYCGGSLHSWTDLAAGGHEHYAVDCVSWYVAFAFCVWDGGRLPTEAEWELAAAGGVANRLYPWGPEAPDDAHAVFNCQLGGSPAQCAPSDVAPIASAPAGVGAFGHRDLAGGVLEWALDAYDASAYAGACVGCAKLPVGSEYRVQRGGGFNTPAAGLRAAARLSATPALRAAEVGLRCARGGK